MTILYRTNEIMRGEERAMGYFIEFWSRSGQYFWLRSGDSLSNAPGHARRIIREFFPSGSNKPLRETEDVTIPGKVRISDEDGKTLGKWSLDEEVESRNRVHAGRASKPPYDRRLRGSRTRV